jgi:hypothetical protein
VTSSREVQAKQSATRSRTGERDGLDLIIDLPPSLHDHLMSELLAGLDRIDLYTNHDRTSGNGMRDIMLGVRPMKRGGRRDIAFFL